MGKVVFWIVVVFAVLLVLRILNMSKAKRRADEARRAAEPGGRPPEAMVRCVRCGVFLPRADAKLGPAGPLCNDPACAKRR
jgi:hypothetical protein